MRKKYESAKRLTLDYWTTMKASVLKDPKQTLSDYTRFLHIRFLIGKAHDERDEKEGKKILANRVTQRFRGG
jgi:hypothetical protein